jgi:CRP/FNR family transcriptional regulator, nitrogen oxide reductase regulator
MQTTPNKLAQISAFAPLEPLTLRALEGISYQTKLEAGQFLYRQGDMALAFYAVYEGGVRLTETTTDGQNVQLKLYGVGELFGLLALSGSYPYPAGIQSVGRSTIFGFEAEAARALMLQHPSLALLMVDLLVAHVHQSHARIRQFAAERIERRLARAVLHYADKFGSTTDGFVAINVPLGQKDLAEFVGTTTETVNRLLKLWEERGYLRTGRQRIDLLDRLAVLTLAEETSYMGQQF